MGTLLSGSLPERTLSGPVVVLRQLGTPQRDFGLTSGILFFVCANYFLLSFLLPYLDGVRLVFLGIQTVLRRPLSRRYERWFNGGVVLLVIVVWSLQIFRDIERLV